MSDAKPEVFEFRDCAFTAIHDIVRADPRAIVLTNDMGAMGLDKIRDEFPDRVVNVGISEQNMMSVAGGLALAGKAVFAYGIIAHITARCFEQIKIDICVPGLPVTLVGVGAGLTYGPDGPTHHGTEDVAIMRSLGGMQIFNPADGPTTKAAVSLAHKSGRPAFIRLDKEMLPALHVPGDVRYDDGLAVLAEGGDAAIISTGVLSWAVRDAAKQAREQGIKARVIDLFRLNPVNRDKLLALLDGVSAVLAVEESYAHGGLGSIVGELLAERGAPVRFGKMNLGDEFLLGSATREWASKKFGLNAAGIADRLLNLCAR